jgi:hypothetical protein
MHVRTPLNYHSIYTVSSSFYFGQCPSKLLKIVNIFSMTKLPLIKFKKTIILEIQKKKN